MKSSEQLQSFAIYTRQALREKFKINDGRSNNGVFHPKEHKSIWLFITQEKAKNMTQYNDRLEGDNLHMDGQTEGGTDKLLIEHEKDGNEVLLFFRRKKTEHPGSGFRYEGRFRYVSHTGTRPAHFHFQRLND